MIQLSGAGKRYGHKLLFENADWLITPESRIGLFGANGTGKSTDMKMLAESDSRAYVPISHMLWLDESTNCLGLEACSSLEEYLTTYPSAFVLISHEHYFLDLTLKRFVEISIKRIHFYPGSYYQCLATKSAGM